MMERQFRILWGPTLDTVLDFSYPVVGDAPRVWRELRAGVERAVALTATDVSVTGKDFFLGVTARWFDLPRASGATGLQAFIDWANAGNAFTLVPDPVGLPTLTVPGCFLDAPFFDPSWSVETEGGMTVDLVIRHPTTDLGLAWRGLFFEYVAGQSLTDPVAYTFTRASVAYEIGPDGYLHQVASGVVADGHYPAPMTQGLQTTLLRAAVTTIDVTNPEALDNASWSKSNGTITANNAKAPDGNVTADLFVENTAVTVTHQVNSAMYTIVAGDVVTALCFVRSAGRFRGAVQIDDATINNCGCTFNLLTNTIAQFAGGTGTIIASYSAQLAGGWTMIWWRGTLGGAITSVRLTLVLYDAGGGQAYTGDGVSGMYLWGGTAVHGVAKTVASYTPSSVADALSAAFAPAPQAMWGYHKWVALGTEYLTSYPRIFAIGAGSSAGDLRLLIFSNKSNTGNNRYGFELWNGPTSYFGVDDWPTVAFGFGDTIEVLWTITATGLGQLRVAVNGGAEVVFGGPSGPGGVFPATFTTPKVFIGTDENSVALGAVGMAISRVGPYVAAGPAAVTTIAAARAA